MNGRSERRCAVVYNPIKVVDEIRDAISQQATAMGWTDPVWLETTADGPRRPTTGDLISAQVDRVIAAGGDGTIRMIADRLAGSGIPMAVVPLGTGQPPGAQPRHPAVRVRGARGRIQRAHALRSPLQR